MMDNKPRLIVVAGSNGSSKASLTEQLLRHRYMDGCEYVNQDNIAHDVFGDWNALEAVLFPGKNGRRSVIDASPIAFI